MVDHLQRSFTGNTFPYETFLEQKYITMLHTSTKVPGSNQQVVV